MTTRHSNSNRPAQRPTEAAESLIALLIQFYQAPMSLVPVFPAISPPLPVNFHVKFARAVISALLELRFAHFVRPVDTRILPVNLNVLNVTLELIHFPALSPAVFVPRIVIQIFEAPRPALSANSGSPQFEAFKIRILLPALRAHRDLRANSSTEFQTAALSVATVRLLVTD